MNPVHHITLSVRDMEASAQWYQRLLGPAEIVRREGDSWSRIRMSWPGGLIIGCTQHALTPADDFFSPIRVGLDHIGLGCATEDEVRCWHSKLDDLGMAHGPLEDAPYGWAVTARDPDGIAVEFFCSK